MSPAADEPTPPGGGRNATDGRGAVPPSADEDVTRLEESPNPRADQQRLLAGRYRLDQLLGRGSMGAVWKAHDVVLRRSVAVKEVLLPATQSAEENEVARERALREARAIAALSHPNVVTLFDVVEDDGRPWVVMELVPAQSLAEIIKNKGPLTPVDAARIGLAVLGALDSAHEVGITHRDVKPGNILVSGDGRVKLADFGISRKVDESSLTQTGLMVGSPSYIAPEVARGKEATRAADIWGLGATLHCAVEGTPPFDLGDPVSTLTAVVGEPPRPAPHAGPLTGVIARALDKDPRSRIRSDELRHELTRITNRPPTDPARRPQAPQTHGTRTTPTIAPPHAQRPPAQRPGTQWRPPPPHGPQSRPVTSTNQYAPARAPQSYAGRPQPASRPQGAPRPQGKQAGQVKSSSNGKAWIIAGVLIALAAVAAVVLIIVLGRDGSGTQGEGGSSSSSTSVESTSTSPSAAAPTANDSKIVDGVASGAISVSGTFHAFSFSLGDGWEVLKEEVGRTEFIVSGSDNIPTSVIKVTVVAETLESDNVDAQLKAQAQLSGSPAALKDYEDVSYQISSNGNAVMWEYTNTMESTARHGFLYGLSEDGEIMWKFIIAGPESQAAKVSNIAAQLQDTVSVP